MAYIERRSEGNTHTVIFKYAALYYYLMWPTLALTAYAVTSNESGIFIAAGIAWVVLIGLAVPMWPTIGKLKKKMRNGVLKASGSKYSFSNPLRYEWTE